ncbi:MAG: phospholipid carrier-dependent glycosyltransferase [Bacteroidia bacterium]
MFFVNEIFLRKPYWWIVIIALIILLPFTGNVHLFDWDEINFAECAREMIVTNTYHTPLINFQPFWEKPPLFIWMQALSMKILGISELAARLPNVINGIITLCLLYYFGKKWYSPSFGMLWALVHLGSILPHLYFRSGIIDPWYNLFGFLFFAGMLEFLKNDNIRWLMTGSVSLGLSVLTKGPAMILITGLSLMIVFFLGKKELRFDVRKLKTILYGFLIFVFTGSSWFLFEYFFGDKKIIDAFLDYQIRLFKTQDSGHGGFLLYHFIVILFGCFPASVVMLRYFSKSMPKDFYSKSMMILMGVVLIIFSIVKTKIVHYSSMSYYSVSFLCAYVLQKNNNYLMNVQKILMTVIGIIIGLILILAGTIEHWKQFIIPYPEQSDVFAAENLKVNVNWYGFEFLSGVFLIGWIVWYSRIKAYSFKHHFYFFAGLILWIDFTINNYVGKIEQYTQNSAIVFFEYCGDNQYLVDTYGYKSYAYLFYGKRMPPSASDVKSIDNYLKNLENAGYDKILSYNLAYLNWLINENTNRPTFVVSKIQDEQNALNTGKFRKLYSKGGYVFFMKQQGCR